MLDKLKQQGLFRVRELTGEDIKKIILYTLGLIIAPPFLVGCIVSIAHNQSSSFFGLWWLGFSRNGIKVTLILEILSAIAVSIMMLLRSDSKPRDEKNRTQSDVAVYGDAHFMTEDEIRRTYTISDCKNANRFIYGTLDEERRLIVSQRRYEKGERPDNNNILLMAAAGSGKSAGVLATMIMQMARSGENMFITDPKGELYAMMARYLETIGYDVFVFSTKEDVMPFSDRFNPLDFINQNVNTALSFATAIMELGDEVTDYFANGELALLVALSLYLTNKNLSHEEEAATIPYIYHILATSPDQLSSMLESLPEGAPGYEAARVFINTDPARQADFISGLVGKLARYSSHECTVMLSQSDFEPLDFMENRAVLFLVMDDHDPTFEPLTRCFFNMFVNAISNLADKYPGRPEVGLSSKKIYPAFNMILEETNNIGKIESLDRLISTVRGRNMNTVLTFQNYDQMKDTYQDKRESLISACHTQIFFGINDNTTAQYVSEWLGTKTVETELKSQNVSNIKPVDIILQEQHRFSDVQALLLTPEQVKEESRTKLLIRTFGRSPMLLYPYLYWNHDDAPLMQEELIYKRLVRRKRNPTFYNKLNLPYKDENLRTERKKKLREFLIIEDIDKYYEDLLGTKIVERSGIDIDRPEPKINPDAARLDNLQPNPQNPKPKNRKKNNVPAPPSHSAIPTSQNARWTNPEKTQNQPSQTEDRPPRRSQQAPPVKEDSTMKSPPVQKNRPFASQPERLNGAGGTNNPNSETKN